MLEMELITQMIETAVIGLIGLLIMAVFVWLRQTLNQREYAMMVWIIRQVVLAAEQLGGNGPEKKRVAVEMAELWLKRYGIRLPVARIAEMIETAVLEELNRPDLLPDGEG